MIQRIIRQTPLLYWTGLYNKSLKAKAVSVILLHFKASFCLLTNIFSADYLCPLVIKSVIQQGWAGNRLPQKMGNKQTSCHIKNRPKMKVGTGGEGSSVPMEGRHRRRGFKCAYSCSDQSRHSRLSLLQQPPKPLLLSMGLTTQLDCLKSINGNSRTANLCI